MQQLALSFEPGLAQRYRDLRECFASCVYQRGLGRVAAAVDEKPSNLSAMLSGDRNLDTAIIERYMQHFEDTTPALYMAARWLTCAEQRQRQALAELPEVVARLNRLMDAAGKGAS
ncbi:hypothetical protein [Lysobacter enzymogenes]|uniref:hypothetical protein n=1 Tax=Lysobacter enzymogenes TaxID=69 RepID=UPI000899A9DA|nr:hypothetical protein [Lysobacter enzymogenes]SDW94102.1 hypothetical protein SAMN05421681_103287 [Lysobacter enzymogenes]